MAKTKKELEALVSTLKGQNTKLTNKLKAAPAVEIIKTEKITAAKLLPIVEGFESEVAQLKHLEQKFNNPADNHKVLVKQYNSQKAIVNKILSKLNVLV